MLADPSGGKRPSRRRLIFLSLLVGIALAVAWFAGGKNHIRQALEPGLRVTAIDDSAKLMTLERPHHKYIVRCADTCNAFAVGKTYGMRDRGGVLEYRSGGRTTFYQVLEEEVTFPTPGGRG